VQHCTYPNPDLNKRSVYTEAGIDTRTSAFSTAAVIYPVTSTDYIVWSWNDRLI
jgi:hypothetical protein